MMQEQQSKNMTIKIDRYEILWNPEKRMWDLADTSIDPGAIIASCELQTILVIAAQRLLSFGCDTQQKD